MGFSLWGPDFCGKLQMPMKHWQNFAADSFGLSTTKALGKKFSEWQVLGDPNGT